MCQRESDRCYELSSRPQLRGMNYLPTVEQLRVMCPKFFQYNDCEKELVKTCTGKSVEEVMTSSNRSLAEYALQVSGYDSLTADICNENSALHRDYAPNIECVRDVVQSIPDYECGDAGREAVKGYLNSTKSDQNEVDGPTKKCLGISYSIACFVNRLVKSCGESAGRALVTTLQMLRPLADSEYACTAEIASVLRGAFFESLTFDTEEKKRLFQSVFEMLAGGILNV
ncbi:hypothetical protein CEXT_478411 [Caerostris extrusa]|uniref:Uncharacterized protein n=1 Tax=Caerostris extrusa TaxID=172846 RepID=A0AAV4UJX7_CAEEX|nr:hypothetical protein CEXT_478411 [Caerostris extrusa]